MTFPFSDTEESTYRILDPITTDVVDRGLTYQQALLWVDNSVGKYYVIEKED